MARGNGWEDWEGWWIVPSIFGGAFATGCVIAWFLGSDILMGGLLSLPLTFIILFMIMTG
jgi:hypothetical protein